jgi:hypothetical protein
MSYHPPHLLALSSNPCKHMYIHICWATSMGKVGLGGCGTTATPPPCPPSFHKISGTKSVAKTPCSIPPTPAPASATRASHVHNCSGLQHVPAAVCECRSRLHCCCRCRPGIPGIEPMQSRSAAATYYAGVTSPQGCAAFEPPQST